jgi:hypothetical protein
MVVAVAADLMEEAGFLEVRAQAVEDFLAAHVRAAAVHLAADRIAPPRRLIPAEVHDLAATATPIVQDQAPILIGRQPEVRAAPRKSLATGNGTLLCRRTVSAHVVA